MHFLSLLDLLPFLSYSSFKLPEAGRKKKILNIELNLTER